jgi:very-short-patch-repair endonuclease
MRPDRLLDEYAARQYGVFSLTQVRQSGFTPKMIETRLATGAWMRLANGVYVLASAPPKWERQMAAALLSRPGSVAAGRSAAHLLDFEGFGTARPVIMIGPGGNARSPIARVIRAKAFNEVERIRARGFEATSPAETLATLSRELDSERLEKLVDECLARRIVTVEKVDATLRHWGGWPGITKMRPLLDERRADAYQPATSELERLLFRLLSHPGIPSHTRQMPFAFETVDMTTDAYIPAWRLIAEGDGRRWHTRVADFERDRRRDNAATSHGYAVLRFTYQMLRNEPDQCLIDLLRTGRMRSDS